VFLIRLTIILYFTHTNDNEGYFSQKYMSLLGHVMSHDQNLDESDECVIF